MRRQESHFLASWLCRARLWRSRLAATRRSLVLQRKPARRLWVLSIMPNRPVRDQWEYQRKSEHFPGQPIGLALATFRFFSEFPKKGKERVCQKWEGEFRSEYSNRNKWSTSKGDRYTEYSGPTKSKRISRIFGIMKAPYYPFPSFELCVCVHVCMRACVHAYMHACMRARYPSNQEQGCFHKVPNRPVRDQ